VRCDEYQRATLLGWSMDMNVNMSMSMSMGMCMSTAAEEAKGEYPSAT
jgi:hypothetical protein